MLLKPFRIQSLSHSVSGQSELDPRSPHAIKPRLIQWLLWFSRFSYFYGEYTGRSLQARQQWLQAKIADTKNC